MKAKINIAVACGGGIFTTTVVTDKIKDILKKEKIPFSINPHKITEVPNLEGYDLIVVTGKTNARTRQALRCYWDCLCLREWERSSLRKSCWKQLKKSWMNSIYPTFY